MPQGYCYFWDPYLLLLGVLANSLLAAVCISFAAVNLYIYYTRKETIFRKLFVALTCLSLLYGSIHLLEIWNIWHASYMVSGLLKLSVAISSLYLLIYFWTLLPKALVWADPDKRKDLVASLRNEASARKKAQEEMLAANQNLQLQVQEEQTKNAQLKAQFDILTERVSNLVWMTNTDGSCLKYANARWLEYSGFEFEDIASKDWRIMIHQDDKQHWEAALQAGKAYQNKRRLHAADGNFNWFEEFAQPMRADSGEIINWFFVCQSIEN